MAESDLKCQKMTSNARFAFGPIPTCSPKTSIHQKPSSAQTNVNRWIKEMQKVTKHERDPSSGTAMQEISFWLSMERALQHLQELRESTEVQLTLDVLKHAKRFHATTSFDTDTGLKQAMASVMDCVSLMKDFPINELLSATDINGIKSSIIQIFVHFKRIRQCQEYPPHRALRFVEAISRDLQEQILKILMPRRISLMDFDSFEHIITECLELFSTWEDEYERLSEILRNSDKKRRTGGSAVLKDSKDVLKMSWRVNMAHKSIQKRLYDLRKFRQQHEELRKVIMRVLATSKRNVNNDAKVGKDGKKIVETGALDLTDGQTISQIDQAYLNIKGPSTTTFLSRMGGI